MPKPTKQDAQVLLSLMNVFLSAPMQEAYEWLGSLPKDFGLQEFEEKYPRGSDGREMFLTLAIFWETAGSLMRRGLLNKDLAFDTFLDGPPWPQLERLIRERRARDDSPAESENLEWIYGKAREWVGKREAAIRETRAPRRSRRS